MPHYLGQHFLKNPAIVKKIIAAADIQKGETIIEIGPGHGEMTVPLAETCAARGAKIVAIEKDAKLAERLQTKALGLGLKNVRVIHGDVLQALTSKSLFSDPTDTISGRYKFVGNIPYYITGHLFRVISELEAKPMRCIFMIQKEVAERIVSIAPKMNRLAASVQFWAEPTIIARAPKTDFSPQPAVDSAVIRFETKIPQPKNFENYYAAVRTLFAQPRKTILNNLSAGERSKEDISRILLNLGINSGLRPQNLTIEDIQDIAGALC